MEFQVTSSGGGEPRATQSVRARGMTSLAEEQKELNTRLNTLKLDCDGRIHKIDREKGRLVSGQKKTGSNDSLASRGSTESDYRMVAPSKKSLLRRGSVDVGLLMNERRAQLEFSGISERRGSDSKLERHSSSGLLLEGKDTRRGSLPPTLIPPPIYKTGQKQGRKVEPPKNVNTGPKTRAVKPPMRKPKSYKELVNDPDHVNYLLRRPSQQE